MLETIVQRISTFSNAPVDQVRCVFLMFLCFPLAFVFRHVLHPSHTPLYIRHLFSAITGFTMATLCFGWNVLVLVLVVGLSYVFLLTVSPQSVHRLTMVWVMACLSAVHLHRTLTDYGGWHLDISGPMMVLVQKLSLVAFAVHDGMGSSGPLNDDQEKQKMSSVPSVLEYMSYCFNFHSILAGPSVTIKEHLAFMDGSNMRVAHSDDSGTQHSISAAISKEPSAMYPVISKLLTALGALFIYVHFFDPNIPILRDVPSNILQGALYFFLVIFYIRCRYYFIFVLNDSISNAAGLGFEGYDSHNKAKWGLASNIDILDMELSMNIRTSINTWNTTTAQWLRRVCYERVSWQPTLQSFILSAWWHGFYPGYYCCLIGFGLSVQAAKKMRRLCNPFFTSHGPVVKWCYHIVTWILTHFYVYYCGLPQVLMWLPEIWTFWQYHYSIPTLAVVSVLVFVPSEKPRRRTEDRPSPPAVDGNSKKHN